MAVGFLVAAAAAYAWLIPEHRTDVGRLATLVPAHPLARFGSKPAGHGPVTATRLGLRELQIEAKADRNRSGAYSVDWVHHSASTAVAELIVIEVPTVTDAARLRKEALDRFAGAKGMKAHGETPGKTFTVPSLPGVRGITFTTSSAASSSTPSSPTVVGHGATVVLGHGNVVAVALVDEKGSSAKADVDQLARRSYDRLEAQRGAVSLTTTSFPTTPTVLYAAGTVLVLALPTVGALTVRRVRRRRSAARQRVAERQRLARGRRTVKRHARRPGPRRPARRR